jgi:hypothetical protein
MGPNEYFLAKGRLSGGWGRESLKNYVVHIFTDGKIIFIEDGDLETARAVPFVVEEIEGQRGKVGFGPSPNSQFGSACRG